MTETDLRTELKDAMRAKDGPRLAVVRRLLSECKNRAIDSKTTDALDDAATTAVVRRELKQVRETLESLEKAALGDAQAYAGRLDEARADIAVLEGFLPQQMSEAELRSAIEAIVAEGAADNIGAVMRALTDRHAGRYDGKAASALARAVLAG